MGWTVSFAGFCYGRWKKTLLWWKPHYRQRNEYLYLLKRHRPVECTEASVAIFQHSSISFIVKGHIDLFSSNTSLVQICITLLSIHLPVCDRQRRRPCLPVARCFSPYLYLWTFSHLLLWAGNARLFLLVISACCKQGFLPFCSCIRREIVVLFHGGNLIDAVEPGVTSVFLYVFNWLLIS